MKKMRKGAAAVAAAAMMACAGAAGAKVTTAPPFGDNMVLQRGRPVAVWGRADPGEEVEVSFAGQRVKTAADAGGAWRLSLKPMPASKERRVFTVRGKDGRAEFRNVLVGEVWLAGGQSNMELPLWGGNPRFRDRQGAMVAQVTRRPFIRFANVSCRQWSVKPADKLAAVWKEVSPETLAGGFSAVAFYYALELYHALDVPVGVLAAYWGGTNIDAWTPREGLASVPALKDVLDYPVTASFKPENRRGPVTAAHQQPAVLYNRMIAPLAPYTLRGAIWYQGEHNAFEWRRYCDKMHALYNGWAAAFENPGFRLYFAQLAPWGNKDIALIQQAQAKFAAEEKNAGMAVINDVGNLSDIHPNEKETVARRLALHAFKDLYGMPGITADSPTLASYKIEGGKFVLSFNNAKSWYIYNPGRGLETGFELAGADGKFVPAAVEGVAKSGVIRGRELVVSAPGVPEPRHLRYLYSRPWFGSLYNEVCLPLGAFHIDAGPGF